MEQIKNYDKLIKLSYEKIVFVMFYTNWCPVCKKLKFTFYEVLDNYPDVYIYLVDLADNVDITNNIKITSTPTTLIYNNGKLLDKQLGYLDYETLEEIILSLKQ